MLACWKNLVFWTYSKEKHALSEGSLFASTGRAINEALVMQATYFGKNVNIFSILIFLVSIVLFVGCDEYLQSGFCFLRYSPGARYTTKSFRCHFNYAVYLFDFFLLFFSFTLAFRDMSCEGSTERETRKIWTWEEVTGKSFQTRILWRNKLLS